MSLAVKVLSGFMEALLNGEIPDLSDSDTAIRCCLTTDVHTPVQNTDVLYSDISTYEITGTNYTVGGVLITGKAVSRVGRNIYFTFGSPIWSTATFTARWAWVYEVSSGTLIGFIDLESNRSVVAGVFSLQVDTDGFIVSEVAA
jgi:hypothetical protein